MNTTDYTPRKDPLTDAYRQAGEHEGARASGNVRAAVLAHARVVTQSIPTAIAHTATLSETSRAATAANEPRPLWRLAAGVVIGLVGVWLFQLSRPASTPDATVATASVPQPQADKARVSEAAGGNSVAAAAAAPETTVAAAAQAPVVKRATADAGAPPARADATSPRKPVDPVRAESNVAIARAAPPVPNADARAPAPDRGSVNAMPSGTVDGGTSEALQETQIASAEMRKSARVANSPLPDQPAMAAAVPRPSPVTPNAFPAQAAAPLIAAAPAAASGGLANRAITPSTDKLKVSPQAAVRPAATARTESPPLDDQDRAMFTAVRAGDLASLRSVIARGANVNARDERGRTAMQIARERNDAVVVDALQAAGAR